MCVCVDRAAGAGAHRRGEATGTATGGDDGDGAATRDMETGAAGDGAEEMKQMRNLNF